MQIPKYLTDIYWRVHNKKFFFLVAAFSVLLNWAGNTFVFENSYKFLYFDTLGTFVAVIVLGSVWGMLVALASAALLSFVTSPHFIYLAVVNVSAALYWGLLSEMGVFDILKSKDYSSGSSLKKNLVSSLTFVLYAGIAGGLLTAVFSSVIRGVIFQNFSTDQPYSLYFAQWFKQIFSVKDIGWLGIGANYIADTFLEIPDKVLTVFFGVAIALTIFKFNIKTLTDTYQEKVQKNEIPWHRIMLSNFGRMEIILFAALCLVYLLKIKNVSMEMLSGFMDGTHVYSLRDYVFFEIILLPLFIFLALVAVKLVAAGSKDNVLVLNATLKDNFYIKNMDRDIKYFLVDAFCISVALTAVYMYILVSITGVTPMEYYKMFSYVKAKPETLVWLFIMLFIFVLIDRANNRATETMTLNDELVKKETVDQISESFDAQRQKLQVMELSWSDNTVEFLRSARHDLVNQLEKSKTGMNELLLEVYDNVVKPYSSSILDSQREMRAYVDELTSGRLAEYDFKNLQDELEKTINGLRSRTASYININFSGFEKENLNGYCRINKLFFIAFNNIIDNSVYALQKRSLEPHFKAALSVSMGIDTDQTAFVSIADNAGGLSKDKINKIYRVSFESSKGVSRLGEGTMIAKNFIKLFGGYISAHNVRTGGEMGLESSIHVPYYLK